jgi:hypothetical protein
MEIYGLYKSEIKLRWKSQQRSSWSDIQMVAYDDIEPFKSVTNR